MRHGLLAGLFLALAGLAWALTPDATREQVIAELGKPTSVAKAGQKEIMIYPGGVRVELEGGKIVATKGIMLTDTLAAEPPSAAPAAPKAVTPSVSTASPQKLPATKDAVEPGDETTDTGNPMVAVTDAIERMEKEHEQGQQPKEPKSFDVLGFLIGFVLKFLLSTAALKLACKYWGVDVFWDTILTVCAVDAAVSGVMTLVGELVLGFPTLFSADDLVGAIVMLFLLKKLSVNHAMGQAIQLTLTTKVFSVVVGSFVITVLLRLLH